MLKGISPLISPNLLKILAEMGHGDEIVVSDAHFPAFAFCPKVERADGVPAAALLAALAPLFELDSYDVPIVMMDAVPGDELDPAVEAAYRRALDYFAFYERARRAYAVVVSGETAKYGNVILKKGVVPVSNSFTR